VGTWGGRENAISFEAGGGKRIETRVGIKSVNAACNEKKGKIVFVIDGNERGD